MAEVTDLSLKILGKPIKFIPLLMRGSLIKCRSRPIKIQNVKCFHYAHISAKKKSLHHYYYLILTLPLLLVFKLLMISCL